MIRPDMEFEDEADLPESLFPARLTPIAKAQMRQWSEILVADPDHDDIGLILRALVKEVERSEAAEDRCKALERDLFDLRSDYQLLDARLERLERGIEAARTAPAYPFEKEPLDAPRPVIQFGKPVESTAGMYAQTEAGRKYNVRESVGF